MSRDLPAVFLVRPHEIRVRGRILDSGKLREITGTARSEARPAVLEVHTVWQHRRKVIRLRQGDLAAVTEPYQ